MSRYGPVVPNQNERPGRYYSEGRIPNRKIKNPAVRVLKVNWYETGLLICAVRYAPGRLP